jgi:hypothetical protein
MKISITELVLQKHYLRMITVFLLWQMSSPFAFGYLVMYHVNYSINQYYVNIPPYHALLIIHQVTPDEQHTHNSLPAHFT